MTIPSVVYPLDLSGVASSNRVNGEKHSIVRKKVVAVAPTHGLFFVNTLQVVDSASGRILTKGQDYSTAEFNAIVSAQAHQDVCSIVLLTDPLVGAEVSLSYQAVGDKYSDSDDVLAAVLNSIDFDTRNPAWPLPVVKVEDVPIWVRNEAKGSRYTFEYAVQAINRIHGALQNGNPTARSAAYAYIEARLGGMTPDLVERVRLAMMSAIGKHKKAANPHPNYFMRGDAIELPKVRKPVNKIPAHNATGVALRPPLSADQYAATYRIPQQAARFQLSRDSSFSTIEHEASGGAITSHTPPGNLAINTQYYWRCCFQNVEGHWSEWSTPTAFTTMNAGVNTPSITSPTSGSKVQTNGLTLTASAFSMSSGSDTYKDTDWEIWTGPNGTGTKVYSAYNKTGNTHQVPANALANNATYYPRVMHRGQVFQSAWSDAHSFAVEYSLIPNMGEQYQGGFFAGTVNLSDGLYGIVLAPKNGGEVSLPLSYGTSQTPTSLVDSVANTTALNIDGAGGAARFASDLVLGGFSDWQVPAGDVLVTILTNLHPYAANIPAVFQTNGSERLFTWNEYWSSTTQTRLVEGGYYDPDVPVYGDVEYQETTYTYEDKRERGSSTGDGSSPDSINFYGAPYAVLYHYDDGPPPTWADNDGVAEDVTYGSVDDLGPDYYENWWKPGGGASKYGGAPARYHQMMLWYNTYTAKVAHTTTVVKREIVGYTPGEYHPETITVYEGRTSQINDNSGNVTISSRYIGRTASTLVRAVRLVKL